MIFTDIRTIEESASVTQSPPPRAVTVLAMEVLLSKTTIAPSLMSMLDAVAMKISTIDAVPMKVTVTTSTKRLNGSS